MRLLGWLTYWPRRLLARRHGCLIVSDSFDVDEVLERKRVTEMRWDRKREGYLVVRDEKDPWEVALEELRSLM